MNKAFLYLHIAVLLAGFTGVFGKIITLDETFLTWYRMIFSGIMLLFVMQIMRKADLKLSVSSLKTALNGIVLGLHWIFFYGSIKYSNISVGVLCFCLTGFFTAILEPLLNKKRISFAELAFSILNVIGIGTIFHFDTSFRTGILLGIISSLLCAVFTIFNERLSKNQDVVQTTALQMIGGAAGLSLLMPFYLEFFHRTFSWPNMGDLVSLFILSLVCTVGMYLALNTALKVISAFTVNLSFNLEPIYSILIAIAFFGERKQITPSFFMGLFLILLSLTLQTIRVVRQHRNKLSLLAL